MSQQQGAQRNSCFRRLDFALEHVFITIIIIKNIISAQPQISAHFQGQKFKKRLVPCCLKAH